MSGIIMLCGQQQYDSLGKPLVGGLIYMLQSGTLNQQNGYRDAALVNVWPNPLTIDASGRVPTIWFADGSIRIRLTDRNGIVLFDADQLPVLGQSGGTVLVDTTDPNARYNTGDLKIRYGTGPLAGFVRANGNTIGPGGSGATEFADPTAQNLFNYLWNLNDNIDHPVTPSRGASAAADWIATGPQKTIKLPDFRGCFLAGLDDMGTSTSGRLTVANFSGSKNAVTLGAFAGLETVTLATANLPVHRHPAYIRDPTHHHGYSPPGGGTSASSPPGFVTSITAGFTTDELTGVRVNSAPGGSGTDDQTGDTGSATPKPTLPPTKLITFYVRL